MCVKNCSKPSTSGRRAIRSYLSSCLRALSPSVMNNDRDGETTESIERVVPATVQAAIEERADRLSLSARAALEWAAVLPERFTFEDLDAVGGLGVGSAIEELADAGFLTDDGKGQWRFVHPIIHDALYRLTAASREGSSPWTGTGQPSRTVA